METITEQSLIVSADDLAVADLDGEAVILDPNSGRYYGLNDVGRRILELAQKPRSVGELLEALQQEYEVDAELLEKDVVAFLQEMESNELIQREAPSR